MPSLHPITPLPVDALAVLAEVAETRVAAERTTRPAASLLRIRILDDEVEVGWLALRPDRHPVEELVGFVAPPDWWGVGVAATGTARHLDSPARSQRVHTVHLVGRDGSWASRWRPLDGDGEGGADAAGDADDPSRPEGRIDDGCRRALELPTSPPEATTAVYWSQRWLDAVVEAAGERRRRVWRWSDVAALHPAVGTVTDARPDDDPPAPSELARMARRLAAWRDWPVLRRGCAAATWSVPEVTADEAAWLDDGAFARWTTGAYPELDDLRAAVAALLPRRITEAVETTLAAGGVVER